MKKFLCMSLCIVLLLVAGCSQQGEDVGSSGGGDHVGGEVEIAFPGTEVTHVELYTRLFNTFIDKYNEENGTSYTVKISSGQSKDITNTRMSSNDVPDVFLLDSPADVAEYVKSGLVLDITEQATSYHWEDNLFDWAYNLAQVDNKVYTLPFGYEGMVLWYNKAIMDELGLDPDAITDKDTFENALSKAQEAGYTPIMLGSQDWPWAQEWYLSILFSYTGRDLVKSILAGEEGASWNNSAIEDTVKLYRSWHETGYLADGKSYILTSDDAINAFTTGKALFKVEGTWATYWITPLEQQEKDNIGVMLHPAINSEEAPHMPLAVGGMWCVANQTQYPEVSAYLLNALLDEDIQSDFLEVGADIAPIAIPAEEFEGLDPVVEDMWNLVNGALENGDFGYASWAFYPPETRVYLYEGIVNVLEGNITIEDYLTQLQTLTDKEREDGFVPILP